MFRCRPVACLLRARAVDVARGARMSRRLTVAMNLLWVAGLVLALTVSRAFATAIVPPPIAPPHTADPGTVTVDAFNSTTQAIVHFDDGVNRAAVAVEVRDGELRHQRIDRAAASRSRPS